MKHGIRFFLAIVIAMLPQLVRCEATPAPDPVLIVQLTVDQLRGDMLPRYRDRFGADGFRRLMERGVYYTNANYGTGNTFTASGHAVLVTGADTAEHGMVANEWFDRESGKVMYATFDAVHGLSPANLRSTTFGDELVSASSGRSRAFAVAGKDRSAIIPAGHLGKAFWFADSTGAFVSSTYYYRTLPAWAQTWNDAKRAERFKMLEWTLLRDASSYRNRGRSTNTYAKPHPVLGRTFPHKLAADSDQAVLSALRATPFLDEYTLAFARELIVRERLGRNGATDYLSISLSGTDYVGHSYGPNSLEYEDNLLRLDTNLAAFLSFLDQTLGPHSVLIVLCADHGVDDIPEAHHAEGYDADRFHPTKILQQMNNALQGRFNTTQNLISAFAPPGFYLDGASIASLNLEREAVQNALAAKLRKMPGVAYALTRTDLLAGRVPSTELGGRIARSFHPTRSGDVVIVQQQFWYLYHDTDCCAAMHGSPYSYDTFVPLIFMGLGIKPASITRPVEPASVAPTLAALVHIKPPSGSVTPVLTEVLIRDPDRAGR